MKPQIVTIINFIRGVEPRDPDLDLAEPVRKQMELLSGLELPATFLLQYDAMIRSDIYELMGKAVSAGFEVGLWLEIVQPLAEKAGVTWRGRPGFPWDWHVKAGTTLGYTPTERKKMIDVFMDEYHSRFGRYPRSAGAWVIDAVSLAYLAEKYHVKAFCNCRDQWGTDGYTLWGGYYGQAYYPSRRNAFLPAQEKSGQIDIPVFRMLGSDPIYQYDAGMDENYNANDWQSVYTLEPTCKTGGGCPSWVRWFFKENFNGHCLSFGYAQAGQENSFGWPAMSSGIQDQFRLIASLRKTERLKAMTLGDAGEWYRSQYSLTPASSITALSDWSGRENRSSWYCSRYYRVNFFWGKGALFIRDIHLFRENYSEPFLRLPCDSNSCVFDSLPLMDSGRWSGNGVRAGIFPVINGRDGVRFPTNFGDAEVSEKDAQLELTWAAGKSGKLCVVCNPNALEIEFPANGWALAFRTGKETNVPIVVTQGSSTAEMCNNGYHYRVALDGGVFCQSAGYLMAVPENRIIRFRFDR